jgi:hypothetical protein
MNRSIQGGIPNMRLMSNYHEQLPFFAEKSGYSDLPSPRGGYPGSTFRNETGDAVNEMSQSVELSLIVLERVLAIALFLWPIGLSAQSSRSANSAAIVCSSRLPESVQSPGESTLLRSSKDGTTYLYVEQHRKNRLMVLDVTHPINISQVSVVTFPGSAFRFVRALGSSSALICLRNNSGSGVVQFRQPKQPLLIAAPDHTAKMGTDDNSVVSQLRHTGSSASVSRTRVCYPDPPVVTRWIHTS